MGDLLGHPFVEALLITIAVLLIGAGAVLIIEAHPLTSNLASAQTSSD